MPVYNPDHIVVEDENFHFLTNYPFEAKVDVIIIDPTYNTGNNALAYSDRNSDWSNFMRDRLNAASKLMADHASIFIHIDDREHHHLRIICDEVLGAKNFVANFIWQKSHTVKNDKRGVSTRHEYVLCYAKDIRKVHLNREPTSEQYIDRAYCYTDAVGRFRVVELFKDENARSFPVEAPNGIVWTRNWNFNQAGFDKLLADGLVYWGKHGTACPRKKVYLKPVMDKTFGTILDSAKVGYTGWGGKALKALGFKKTDFLYPKPPELIQHLLEMATQPDALVLDFFAGSGTTAEAVFRLNQKDGGSRRVILCNSDENDICRKLTYPRAVKAAQVYGEKRKVTFLRAVESQNGRLAFEGLPEPSKVSAPAVAPIMAPKARRGAVRASQGEAAGVVASAR